MNFDFLIYNQEGLVGIFDDYSSLIWTGNFLDTGECQITAPATERNRALLQEELVIVNQNRARVNRPDESGGGVHEELEACIIQNVKLSEDEKTLEVKAKALDFYLGYRVVPQIVSYSASFGLYAKTAELFGQAFPSGDAARTLAPWLIRWPYAIQGDVTCPSGFACSYKTLLATLQELYAYANGDDARNDFRVFFERGAAGTNRCVLKPTAARDLTQTVVFSDRLENVYGFEMESGREDLSNVAIVAGEGEGSARVVVWAPQDNSGITGADRRELFVDARDMKQEDYGSLAEYQAALRSRGIQKLVAQVKSYSFQIPPDSRHAFKKDFYLGDRVGFEMLEYGVSLDAQVTQVIETFTPSGYSCEATFGDMRESLAKRINKRFGN